MSSKDKTKNKKKMKKTNMKTNKNIGSEDINIKDEKGNYFFIYLFISIIAIAFAVLAFLILNDKLYLTHKNPIVTIKLEKLGDIKIELEPTKAPNTVNNIIKLIENEFYDDKVVYGRDAVSIHFGRDERGLPPVATTSVIDESIEKESELDIEYEIDGEFEKNNFKFNNLKHEKYVVSLVRADYTNIIPALKQQSYNSGSPMFKILYKDAPGMNGNYAAFGKVIEGFDIIDKLAERKLSADLEEEDLADLNEFKSFVKIKSVSVETFGKKCKEVKLHKKFDLTDFMVRMLEDRI